MSGFIEPDLCPSCELYGEIDIDRLICFECVRIEDESS